MFENEEIRKMKIQKTAKIRDDLCYLIHKEDFSQTAVNSVWEITQTETNMTDALNIKKKLRHGETFEYGSDLFFANELVRIPGYSKTLIAVCNSASDFKNILTEINFPSEFNNLCCYEEIVILTNYWNSKVFEKHKNGVLDFSIREDVRIGIFLVTDYGSAKIMKIS